jgi:lantibiotic modifying enzyme
MSGVMWCIDHLTTEGVIEYENDDQDIHDYLEEQSLIYANDNNFDFLHGANGLALYLLRKESNLHLFNEIIELLFSKGIIHDDTIKWESVVNFDSRRKGYNLSLSHGISSIIIILSKFIEKYPNHKRAIELVNLSINYLLSKKNHPTLSSLYKFPSYIDSEYDDEQARIQSRLGWCYGDMGNAVALYTAGQVLKNHNLIDEALEIMLHSTKNKDLNAAGAKDAGLCHGTAGISHIFNRFYQCTGKLEFKNAALYWLERTLEMATFEDGFAGYKTFQGQETWKSELSFLDGVAGIGLVLMSTISDVEPKWDNCLLLS